MATITDLAVTIATTTTTTTSTAATDSIAAAEFALTMAAMGMGNKVQLNAP